MSAIDELEQILSEREATRKSRSDDLDSHTKSVQTCQKDIDNLSKEIEEYKYAITLLKEELHKIVGKGRNKSDRGYVANKPV